MSRILVWWLAVAVSSGLTAPALFYRSGSCTDAPSPSGSSCQTTGAGGLLVVGLALLATSIWMLRRSYRSGARR